jgi:hypothetical protein
MARTEKRTVTIEELLVSSLAQTDALAKLLIEKGVIQAAGISRPDHQGSTSYFVSMTGNVPDGHYRLWALEVKYTRKRDYFPGFQPLAFNSACIFRNKE